MRTFTTDSSIATQVVPALFCKKGALKKRVHPVRGVVVHFTGSGTYRRWLTRKQQYGDKTPFETSLFVYGNVTPHSAHYVVGQEGECAQVAPESLVPLHVGALNARQYATKWWSSKVPWWKDRWPELKNPTDLCGGHAWDMWSCNMNTIGIEVSPPSNQPVTAAFTQQCMGALFSLCKDICDRHNIPFDKYHVVGHCDVHPISRTKNGIPWDPFARQWSFDKMLSDVTVR